jgi:3-deoxy-7-phosphoheptulonate synthase
MNSPPDTSLERLRAELDAIDDRLLELIEKRLALSKAIGAQKNAEGDRRLKIRPGREAQVVARLQSRAMGAGPQLIASVWKELMAYSVQAQARTELVLAPVEDTDLLEAQVRAHFGSAPPLNWAASEAAAIRRALLSEAVAILPHPLSEAAGELRVFDVIRSEDGSPTAYAVGRVAEEDAARGVPPAAPKAEAPARNWSPGSWRSRPAAQLPEYPDEAALGRVERRLSGSAPLVEIADILHLRAALARIASGSGFLLQGGDCAESFAEFGADKVRVTYNLLLRMGAMLRAAGAGEVVHLARIAGQFAKPRSSMNETAGDVTLPSYRGDAVNGPAFTPGERIPDPRRLLDAHRQAQVTIELLHAYAAASYADLPEILRAVGLSEPARPVAMFTSHEALLLNYEQALTRFDEASDSWWATSGHMLWIGDRTRSLDGAHVEFARGVANPVGLKCGPSLEADDLLRLIERLDPDNRAGRLVLIGRFGAGKIAGHLPALMRATRREGRNVIWSIDPMHGNTMSVGAIKTRLVADIVAEVEAFFAIARAEAVHPGGVHLEMTGSDVTECLGGSANLAERDLALNYLTHCDPRLNRSQAMDVASAVAQAIDGRAQARTDAA